MRQQPFRVKLRNVAEPDLADECEWLWIGILIVSVAHHHEGVGRVVGEVGCTPPVALANKVVVGRVGIDFNHLSH